MKRQEATVPMHGTVFSNRAAETTVSPEKHSRVKIRGAVAILHVCQIRVCVCVCRKHRMTVRLHHGLAHPV